jgi:uncharacterized lipoprotein YehR (DUF1307 family)
MTILLVEFVDCDEETEEYEGKWEIKDSCLVIYEKGEKLIQTIIPLYNILRMIEYME